MRPPAKHLTFIEGSKSGLLPPLIGKPITINLDWRLILCISCWQQKPHRAEQQLRSVQGVGVIIVALPEREEYNGGVRDKYEGEK